MRRVYHASLGGTSAALALRFAALLAAQGAGVEVVDACSVGDPESVAAADVAVVFVSTYDGGQGPPGGGAFFTSWFADAASDERVGAAFLAAQDDATKAAVAARVKADLSSQRLESLTLRVARLRHLVREAAALGALLRDVEAYVQSYGLLL